MAYRVIGETCFSYGCPMLHVVVWRDQLGCWLLFFKALGGWVHATTCQGFED